MPKAHCVPKAWLQRGPAAGKIPWGLWCSAWSGRDSWSWVFAQTWVSSWSACPASSGPGWQWHLPTPAHDAVQAAHLCGGRAPGV